MNEEAELHAKIAALAGQINKRKQQSFAQSSTPSHFSAHPPHGSNRWAPYARGGRGGFPAPHKNRTLVLKSTAPQDAEVKVEPGVSVPYAPVALSSAQDAFVSTRSARMNQLMTKETFAREQRQRQEQLEQLEQQRPVKRPRTPLNDPSNTTSTTRQPLREIEIDGIRFHLKEDGSKLIRIRGQSSRQLTLSPKLNKADPANDSKQTPKKAKIADVEFYRTKSGNLVRMMPQKGSKRYRCPKDSASPAMDSFIKPYRLVKRAPKPQCENFTKHGTNPPAPLATLRRRHSGVLIARRPAGKNHMYCANCGLGTCVFGPSCKFTHNPEKVAICKELMRNGSCKAGEACDMSHELTYHRVPACTHFQRGNCTNSACRYPHVQVSPAARVCRPFATLGYCAKGPGCDDRHVFECPDYASTGHCANHQKGACALQHVDRAAALRKAARKQAKHGSEDESDISSDEDEMAEQKEASGLEAAVDSDSDLDTDIEMGSDEDSHPLSQQQDFVSFL